MAKIQRDWHAIEFTKTRGWEVRDPEGDKLPDFPSLLRWAAGRDLIEGIELAVLARHAAEHPHEGDAVLRRAHALRDLLYAVLRPVGAGALPAAEDIDRLNQTWRSVVLHRRLGVSGEKFDWSWNAVTRDEAPLDRLLWPVVQSAMDLLVAPERARLRLCSADDCGWLFIDASRNRSRRWCDMGDCGNRAKVRRFRERKRPPG